VVAVSIDGQLLTPAAAVISVFDRGLLYGDGCFEVLRTWDGVARDLDAHLDRLYETAKFLDLRALERPRLVEAVYRTIAAAVKEPGERKLRIVLTRGEGGLAERIGELGPGRAIVIVEPLGEQPAEVSLAVVDWPVPRRRGRGHKTLAYLDNILARELARAAAADEAVRLDDAGHVIEGATCNIFAVIKGTVVTPPTGRGALPGIVRSRVLELCEREGIPAAARDVTLRELRGADELFITSSLRGVVPVTVLDKTLRSTGPITPRLAHAYQAMMRTVT